MTENATKTIAVIDGNSLMHRAYHAVMTPMNAPDGTPTNAVFGFLSMLLKFIDMEHPDAIICAFDAGKPKFRMEALARYKAQRPPMDQELRVQFPLIEELLTDLKIPVVKLAGWEGDDILGTVSAKNEELGYRTLLVSGDKDIYQLATQNTHIVTTRKGMTDVAIYGPAEVFERYGVQPSQFTDYLGLMGDSSDNIPGVPGVGPKKAQALLAQYGTLEGIYEHIGEQKGKLKENLEQNEELAYVSREVATIMRDVDIDVDVEDVTFPAYTAEEAVIAFGKLGLKAHLGQVLRLIGDDSEPIQRAAFSVATPVEGDAAIALAEAALAAGERIGIAVVRPEQTTIFGQERYLGIATASGCGLVEGDEAADLLARIVRDGEFVALDAKQAMQDVFPPDSGEAADVTARDVLDARFFDCSLAAYVLDSSQSPYTAQKMAERYLDVSLPEAKESADEAVMASQVAFALAEPLSEALSANASQEVYATIDAPLVGVLAGMERVGAAIDATRLREIGDETAGQLDDLRAQIWQLAGEEFNIDSPKQLGVILFEKLGLKHGKKNQRGYSTDAKVLTELAKTHELPGLVLKYRELAKIKSTYIDTLPYLRREDGFIHTQFNETVTTTGRLSSSNPNLQNIPVRTDFGRQIRECFVPLRAGDVFLSADYSQIELRLLAHLSGDEGLIAAFQSGMDFHAATAASIYGLAPEDVTPQIRSHAKAVNFGIVYGQQAFGLSQTLGISFGEAKDIIDRYFATYPRVREYLDEVVAQAKRDGYATTMFGRRRHIPDLRSTDANKRAFGERTAMNHPMQGSAADIIKLAMARVQRRLIDEGYGARLMLQVHDELDFSVPEDEVERLAAMCKQEMEGVAELRVPLIADVSWGPNWAEAH